MRIVINMATRRSRAVREEGAGAVDGKGEAAVALARLGSWLEERGLKHSRQRDVIVETFYAMGGHVPVDGLVARVRSLDARVSVATVYRTMKLLAECGIALPRRIDEFKKEKIEELQIRVARNHGFEVESHKLELYGRCDRCRRDEPGSKDA